ncbi:glycosyltransferase [Opitutus terrae]|uniref:Alpha 1,4-glycosyltransferase domain-containing protein n=1 Tax=Opitutus terrae (strain DSM 11246 / JCM 15787 / PB90-1) TaxID=452637 RepID=B1ZW31_OPITP|nr:glycosyltransferase [Opitutus terrae]ACB76045.1 hypothetical protein Oter_2764 [Opitutus terrae PB90-1]
MTRPIVQFLWMGCRLSTLEQLCLRSFLAHGRQVHLYTYQTVEGVPEGVQQRDGREILPESAVFAYKEGFGKGSHAGFSDLFRYHLLRKKGGWWFDMDFVALRPIPTPDDLWMASTFEGEWGECANNCALYAPPGHPALVWLCDEAERIIDTGTCNFGDTGPFLVQRLVREKNLHRHMAPWWVFSPYPWRQIHRVAITGSLKLVKDQLRCLRFLYWQMRRKDFRAGYLRRGSLAIHLHNEIWRSLGMDKDAAYHPLCLFERLKRKYLLES